ncbi:MAG: adenosylhomocysteinase [Bacteroidales bacterium]|nr:adenosylhomocysteinase [Bacteroidales bacterium]MBQ2195197.1 adenosylhomocysteinase [Bacteroidales bacterium]MBQ4222103.1 adenosylhomocysteinase [Bacteroidales bacterium]
MKSEIRNLELWPDGALKIEWVRHHMPLLNGLEAEFRTERPFAGLKVALSVHLEAKTAYLCEVLAAGGAEMYVTGSNPLSTQDDVAAALVHEGLNVFAWHGATPEEYEAHIRRVLAIGPNIIIDDGGDLVSLMHSEYRDLLPGVIGGCEETTTGILRLQALDKARQLEFPMMLVNNADCKHLFDNRYGTGQSVWDGINRTTNLIVAGKTVVVAGYGWCGKGVAMRAKGLGAQVVVTEVDPIKAMEAVMDGFSVMPMDEAARVGDLFVTVTGCAGVITPAHFAKMKDGAILCNAGHFDVEVDVAGLRAMAVEAAPARNNIMGYRLENGRKLYVIAEGRLVNLAAGDGHPAEIMDMSFAIQALSARYLASHRDSLPRSRGAMLHDVPREIDEEVARRKIAYWGCRIDTLTPEQHKYLYGE